MARMVGAKPKEVRLIRLRVGGWPIDPSSHVWTPFGMEQAASNSFGTHRHAPIIVGVRGFQSYKPQLEGHVPELDGKMRDAERLSQDSWADFAALWCTVVISRNSAFPDASCKISWMTFMLLCRHLP